MISAGMLSSEFSNVLSLRPADKDSVTTNRMTGPMVLMDWEECPKALPKLTQNMLGAGYKNESYDAC
ncbi:hypothetical protein MC885_001334 [Smutsia gigantea]|nr:hypothetical protein MC885_001334 [Smutsia gigantea]